MSPEQRIQTVHMLQWRKTGTWVAASGGATGMKRMKALDVFLSFNRRRKMGFKCCLPVALVPRRSPAQVTRSLDGQCTHDSIGAARTAAIVMAHGECAGTDCRRYTSIGPGHGSTDGDRWDEPTSARKSQPPPPGYAGSGHRLCNTVRHLPRPPRFTHSARHPSSCSPRRLFSISSGLNLVSC